MVQISVCGVPRASVSNIQVALVIANLVRDVVAPILSHAESVGRLAGGLEELLQLGTVLTGAIDLGRPLKVVGASGAFAVRDSSSSRHEDNQVVSAGRGFFTFFASQGRRLASPGMCADISG